MATFQLRDAQFNIIKDAYFRTANINSPEGQQALIECFDEYMNRSRFPEALYESNMERMHSMGAAAGLKACGFNVMLLPS